MHEGLGQVAPQLSLTDVELFGQQTRCARGGAASFEEHSGGKTVSLLVLGQGQDEVAEQKSAFAFVQRPVILAEAVDVIVST